RDGSVAVAWEDTRGDKYEVFIQWFDSLGNRLGSNERVNDNPMPADCYSPSCAFAPDGRLAVLFNDERAEPGMPEIYVQRFGPDRARLGANMRFSSRPEFPGNVRWTVGQSIAASADRVVAAWTDNQRHRGWDIFAKVTDWELAGVEDAPRRTVAGAWLAPSVGRVFRIKNPAARVSVTDCAGRVRQASVSRGLLDLAGFAPGVYYVSLEQGKETLRRKLIVR
ncbi:T9SS type A sorting domain-containing protein, partial [candidate division WOR-3 bacterium]|nr:T9SS type A sorting domain-containing protein [candidate division WOR-3 bacterium]